jgi:hypothetical protein
MLTLQYVDKGTMTVAPELRKQARVFLNYLKEVSDVITTFGAVHIVSYKMMNFDFDSRH